MGGASPAPAGIRLAMSQRLPRPLHPGAWWLWALGMATAASRTTNPLTLVVFAAVVGCVVSFRRTDAPWARGFSTYLRLGLVILAIRVVFRVLIDGQFGTTILFTLPELHLPKAAAAIRIGGPVSLQGLLAAVYDGVRLATLLLCLGAANVLADPKRLLKSLPAALHEMGVAVTVALTVAPQLVESGQRIRKARKLRGAVGTRKGLVRGVLIPVLEDALDRSLVLAAAMDSRGYGRRAEQPRSTRIVTAALVLGGVVGVCVGTYGVLDGTTPRALGGPMLAVGCVVAVVGIRLGGRRVRRSVYRPDPWGLAEWMVVACGLAAAAAMFLASSVDPDNLYPTLQPLRWPTLGVLPAIGALIGVLPAVLAPPVYLRESPSISRDVAVAP
jgi:energy-coupling factor transport system permease protein